MVPLNGAEGDVLGGRVLVGGGVLDGGGLAVAELEEGDGDGGRVDLDVVLELGDEVPERLELGAREHLPVEVVVGLEKEDVFGFTFCKFEG